MVSRAGAALALAVAALAFLAPAAFGHAQLTGTSPERGAVLRTQPSQVVFRFGEPVEASFGAVRVFDANARRVDDGQAHHPAGDEHAIAVGLRAGLADGTYTATYRIVSADGHPVSGGLVFSVGRPGAAPKETVDELIGGQRAGPVTQVGFGAVKALSYLAIALFAGGLLFLLAVWRPVAAPVAAQTAFAGRWRAIVLGAAVLGVVTSALGIAFQGATAAGTSLWSALDTGVLGDVLGTRVGSVWALRGVLFVLAGAALLLARRPPRGAGLVAACAVAAGLVVTPALGGHASTQSPTALLIPLDVVHVSAMSAWIAGLVLLLFAVPVATRALEPGDRTRLLAGVLLRFSPLALGCVAALLVTGVVQSLEHLSAWSDLTDTAFGRAVLIKVCLLAVLIGVGAVNRQRVVPRLRAAAGAVPTAAPGATGRLLRTTLRLEVALVVVVLGVTGALVGYPPPTALAGGPYSADRTLGPIRLEATIDPALAGPNEMHLYLLHAKDGSPFTATKELTVTAELPPHIAPIAATARKAGPGHYVVDTLQLTRAARGVSGSPTATAISTRRRRRLTFRCADAIAHTKRAGSSCLPTT